MELTREQRELVDYIVREANKDPEVKRVMIKILREELTPIMKQGYALSK